MNQTRSLVDRSLLQQKEFFGSKTKNKYNLLNTIEYEMVEVFGDSLVFNSQKVAMLTFNMVFEQRAKN